MITYQIIEWHPHQWIQDGNVLRCRHVHRDGTRCATIWHPAHMMPGIPVPAPYVVTIQLDDSPAAPRTEAELHADMVHPEWEYGITKGPRKNWDVAPPEGEGWEPNVDLNGGFERFDYHEQAYWRRRKPGGFLPPADDDWEQS